MEYPFPFYGHSGVAPPLRVPVPTPPPRALFPGPGLEQGGTFGFRQNYSAFLGRLRSANRTVLIMWVGHDRLTVSRHFQPGSLSREVTRSVVFSFGSKGGSLTGAGRA